MRLTSGPPLPMHQAILQSHPAIPQRHSEVSAVREMYSQDASPYDQAQFPQPRPNSPYAHHPQHPVLPPPDQPPQTRGRKRKTPPADQALNPGFEYTSNSDYSPGGSAPQEETPSQELVKTGPGGRQLSTSKRAEQNRKAQRAFRERRDQHVKMLESRSQLLDAALASADEANRRWEECRALVDQLRAENAALRAALQHPHHPHHMPPPPQAMVHPPPLPHLPHPPPPDPKMQQQPQPPRQSGNSRPNTPKASEENPGGVAHSRTPSTESASVEPAERNSNAAAAS